MFFQTLGPTLVLTWIPNSTLRKNTKSIENSPNRSHGTTPKSSPRRTPRQEFAKTDNYLSSPTTCMTDLSPLDSCPSIGSEGDRPNPSVRRKKHSIDSATSDISMRTDSYGITPDEENVVRSQGCLDMNSKAKNSVGASSEAGDNIQNNERCISNLNKEKRVGQHVNELYVDKVSKINSQLDNLTKLALADEEVENRTAEKTHKSRHRNRTVSKQSTSSNKSVSIEMDGDNLCITTEELDDDVLEGADAAIDNISNNVPKDAKSNSCSSCPIDDSTNHEHICEEDQIEDEHSCINVEQSESYIPMYSGDNTDNSTNRTSNIPQHPQSLDLSAINTTVSSQSHDLLGTPDISVTRHRNSSSSSTTTSGPDSEPPSPYSSSPSSGQSEPIINLDSPSSPDSFSHNLQFPENSVYGGRGRDKKSAKDQVCGVFSVDLGQ